MPLSQKQESYLGQLRLQISESRLAPYLRAASGDTAIALAHYYWNVELCQAYYPVLHAVEIALRNNLDRSISSAVPPGPHRDIPSWLDRVPAVLARHAASDAIIRAKSRLPGWDPAVQHFRDGAHVTHGDLVAELSLGFWLGLLDSSYDTGGSGGVRLWPDHLKKVFPGAVGKSRAEIHNALNQLRHFRNRVFHYEPVWAKRAGQLSPKARYDSILCTLRWLGGEQSQIAARIHGTPKVFDAEVSIPEMHTRLIAIVDSILELAQRKKQNHHSAQTGPVDRRDDL